VDEDLKKLLQHLQDAVANSWDGVILVDGLEGSGKSGLGLTIAYELDKSFNIERLVFTPEQFFKAVENSQVEQAIVWAEFITGGMSSEAVSKVQREVTRLMVMIRKKRLYIILILPYFFMTSRYFAVARSRFLLHTYTPDGIRRGRWQCWNYERKRQMYFRGRKEFDYCVRPYKHGIFGDFFKLNIINKNDYEQKKDSAINALFKEEKKPEPTIDDSLKGIPEMIKQLTSNRKTFKGEKNDYEILFEQDL
jgi:hypothetical protein